MSSCLSGLYVLFITNIIPTDVTSANNVDKNLDATTSQKNSNFSPLGTSIEVSAMTASVRRRSCMRQTSLPPSVPTAVFSALPSIQLPCEIINHNASPIVEPDKPEEPPKSPLLTAFNYVQTRGASSPLANNIPPLRRVSTAPARVSILPRAASICVPGGPIAASFTLLTLNVVNSATVVSTAMSKPPVIRAKSVHFDDMGRYPTTTRTSSLKMHSPQMNRKSVISTLTAD